LGINARTHPNSETPITELLEQEPTKTHTKDARDKKGDKDNKRKLDARANEKKDAKSEKKPSGRPAHELPSSFPAGLKRPDLTATVDGKNIASEFQRRVFDDIRHDNCIRYHAKDHTRASCKEPAGKWETKFDTEKDKYWAGTLKWQQNSLAEKAPNKTPAKPKVTLPPTLVQKDSRRHTLAPLSSDSDDEDLPLQSRAHQLPDPPDSDDADSDEDHPPPFRTADAVAHYHYLQIVHLSCAYTRLPCAV
jgi:hypothetical protein